MPQPRFRFIDGGPFPITDAQFWRDVEASDRLGSPFKANQFLRELCHAKAWDAATPDVDPEACAAAERRLLRDVSARGFRLFGPDLDRGAAGATGD
jgi:hypothetical protein